MNKYRIFYSMRIKRFRIRYIALFVLISIFMSSFAYADAGLAPFVSMAPLVFFISLAFISLVEVGFYCKALNVEYGKAMRATFISNLVTALIGMPLSLVLGKVALLGLRNQSYDTMIGKIMLTIVSIMGDSPMVVWLFPRSFLGKEEVWIVPLAIIVWLIPTCILSVYFEYQVIKRFFFKDKERVAIRQAAWKANAVTYFILLVGFMFLWFGPGIVQKQKDAVFYFKERVKTKKYLEQKAKNKATKKSFGDYNER